MRVFLLSLSSPFFETAPSKRISCYLSALKSEGVDCIWLSLKQDQSYGHPLAGIYDGIPYLLVGGCCPSHPKWRRKLFCIFSDLSCLFYLFFHIKKNDVLFSFGAKYPESQCFINLAHFMGAKFFRDLCELPYGTGCETSMTKRKRELIQTRQFPKYDGVISISDSLFDYAKTYSRIGCKHIKVPILVDYEQYCLADKSSEAEIPYIFHSGTLTQQKDGILDTIEAFGKACKLIDKPINFICTGNKENSQHCREINNLIEEYHLQDKLVFTGHVTNEVLKAYLQKASVVVINKMINQQNTYCFSTKLGEYMSAGKAIIITDVGEAMNWLTDGMDVLVVPPADNTALTAAIVSLFNNDALRKMLGMNARKTCAKSFDFHIWGRPMLELMSPDKI